MCDEKGKIIDGDQIIAMLAKRWKFKKILKKQFFKSEIIELSEAISINILENKDTFSEIEWKELYKLSENTFVEENESLKQSGAGAGLTDND